MSDDVAGASEIPMLFHADEMLEHVVWNDLILDADQIVTAMSRIGRNESPAFLIDMFREDCYQDLDALAAGIEHAWTAAEFPSSMLDQDDWDQLFSAVGYLHNEFRSPRRRPRKAKILHRGCVEDGVHGWSWTDDLARAEWFAERPFLNGAGRVWRLTVPPDRIRARFPDGRGEQEYVVDTRGLSPVELQR